MPAPPSSSSSPVHQAPNRMTSMLVQHPLRTPSSKCSALIWKQICRKSIFHLEVENVKFPWNWLTQSLSPPLSRIRQSRSLCILCTVHTFAVIQGESRRSLPMQRRGSSINGSIIASKRRPLHWQFFSCKLCGRLQNGHAVTEREHNCDFAM